MIRTWSAAALLAMASWAASIQAATPQVSVLPAQPQPGAAWSALIVEPDSGCRSLFETVEVQRSDSAVVLRLYESDACERGSPTPREVSLGVYQASIQRLSAQTCGFAPPGAWVCREFASQALGLGAASAVAIPTASPWAALGLGLGLLLLARRRLGRDR